MICIIRLLVVLLCTASLSTACASDQKPMEKEKTDIRFDENNLPSFIKGPNLTASLDNDPTFARLKKKGKYEEIAFAYLEDQAQLLKLSAPRREFEVKQVKVEGMGLKHVKLQQTFNNIPVWAKEIIVHLNQRNEVYLFQGKYLPLPQTLEFPTRLTEEKAKSIATAQQPQGQRWKVLDVKQYIWAPDASLHRPAYRLTLLKNGFERTFMFVDACNGNILHTLSGTPHRQ